MAEERRQVREGWLECQGSRLREKARHELETSPARRRLPEKYVTKSDVHNDINRVLARLDRLESKIDDFMKEQRSALG